MRVNERMKKVFSILLCLCMVLTLVPTTAFAATEVPALGSQGFVTYAAGVTQHVKYDNYLYKVTYTNLKNTEELYLKSEYNYLCAQLPENSTMFLVAADGLTELKVTDLPKTEGGTLNCYYGGEDLVIDMSAPVVIITCVAVNELAWSWASDYSSATAVFTASEADVCVTLSADASFVATECSEGDRITYTASVTFNGNTYTDQQEVIKPHDWNKQEGPTCDQICSRCGSVQAVAHTYDNACDTSCNVCGATWETEHHYDSDCDSECNSCGVSRETTIAHTYDYDCDQDCNACGEVRDAFHNAENGACTYCGMRYYGVLVAGVQITEANASDVLGDGTMSYDADTNTLTLTGATVDAYGLNVPALEITDGTVTLVLHGDNELISYPSVVYDGETGEWGGYPAISIAESASVIITGDSSATLKLQGNGFGYTAHDHIPSAAAVSGGGLTVSGGSVIVKNAGGIRLSGDYIQTGGTMSIGYLEAQNVSVSGGTLDSDGWSGISPEYWDPNAGGIHGIFAQKSITVSGGSVTTSSGVLGHDGNYIGQASVTGEEVVTHGMYALENITISGGTVTSTGGSGGYAIDNLGMLSKGSFAEDDEWIGTPAGAALEAPMWSISDAATFICGSETSHRGGTQTCRDEQCVFCGEPFEEIDHSYDETTHVCSVCGKVETFTVYWGGLDHLGLMEGTSTYGQDFTHTFTVPENTHLEIKGVYLRDDPSVPVEYTFENGVLTIPAEDRPAADIEIDCYHYVEVKFDANGGEIVPEDGYPLPGDTGFAEDGSYWIQTGPIGWEIQLYKCANVLREGYAFVDWRDASGKVYPMAIAGNVEPYVLATEDVTLYARWQCLHTGEKNRTYENMGTYHNYVETCVICSENTDCGVMFGHAYDETTHSCVCGAIETFTITFDPANGEEKISITQDYGTPITAPELTYDGYHFLKWDREVPATMPAMGVDEELTITAIWEAHIGGKATCTQKAKCKACSTEYGELLDHKMYPADGKCIHGCGKLMAVASVSVRDNTTYYEGLNGAFEEAKDCTADDEAVIKLLQDVTLNKTQYIQGGVFTLDLNDKDIKNTTNWNALEVNGGDTAVTIMDSGKNGAIYGGADVYGVYVTNATLIITGGSIIGADNGHGVSVTDGTLRITGGEINGEAFQYSTAVSAVCTDVTISGGTISGGQIGVYAENSAVTITDGTFKGPGNSGVFVRGGTTTISGGSFNGDNEDIYAEETSVVTLNVGENGVGAQFPGGITVTNTTLDTILGDGLAYWQDGKMIVTTEVQTEIADGDVTVKAACTHEGNTNISYTDNGDGTHSFNCSGCGITVVRDHTLTYIASGSTITATCSENCGYSGTATVSAVGKNYDGTAVAATVSYSDGWPDSTELTITYAVKDGEMLTAAPVNAGTYTASITYGGQTARVDFTIAPKELTAEDVTITLSPDSFLYDGLEKLPTVTIKLGDKVLDGGTYADGYTPGNTTCDYRLVIPNDRVTPSQKAITIFFMNNYSGEAVVHYCITVPEAILSSSEPNGENGWYKSASLLAPDGYAISTIKDGTFGNGLDLSDGAYESFNYWLTNADNANCEPVSLTWTGNIKVDGTGPEVTKAGAESVTDSTASITVTADDARSGVASTTLRCSDSSVTIGALTNGAFPVSGMQPNTAYTFTLTVKDEAGNETVTTVNLTTEKGDSSVTKAPTASKLTYTGEAQPLVTPGEAKGGTMQYSLDNQNWSADIPTGINADTYTVYYKVVGDSNYNDTAPASVPVTIAKAKLTITAEDNTITYGDAPTANGVTGTGFIPGESFADLSGELAYSYNYEQFSDVGTYKITPAGLSSDNYEITFADGTLTVNAKAITVKADAVSKTYGEADPVLTYKVEGLVNGDELTGEMSRAAGENAGSYDIEQNTLTAGGNYAINFTGAELTIKPKTIADSDVELNGSLTYTGEQQTQEITVTEGITYEVSGNTATNVGTYELIVKGTDNYTGSVTKQWSIAKAEPQIVWNSGYRNSYGRNMYITAYINGVDGNLLPGTAIATVYDAEGNELNSVTCTKTDSTGAYGFNWLNKLDDGTYLTVGSYVVKLTYQGDANYNGKTVELVTYTISKADPVIGTVGCDMQLFDSTAVSDVVLTRTDDSIPGTLVLTDAELTAGVGTYNWKFTPADGENYNTITGTVELTVTADVLETIAASGNLEKDRYSYGDTFSIDGLTITATYTSGATKDVTEFASFDSTLAVGQTFVELTYGDKTCTIDGITVAKKQLVISDMAWDIPENAVYSGTAYTATLTGDLPEGVTVTKTGDAATNAGSYTAKAVFSLAEGYSADNYEIVNGGDLTADWSIAKKNIADAQITLGDSLTYNGNEQTQEVAEVKIGDLTVTYDVTANKQLSAGNYILTVTGNGNFEGEATANWTIAKAKLTITANNNSITYGDVPAANGVTGTGFVSSESLADLSGELAYSYNYEQFGNVGTYKITPSGVTSGNYEITFADGTLTVNAKAITITADAVGKTYGAADPALTYKVEGLVNGDELSGELKRVAGENVGDYAIEQNSLTAGGNYAINFTGAELTVNKRDVTITAKDQTITCGETISGTEITAIGLVDGHSATATLTPSTANVTANGTITASAAVISADGVDVTGNYNVSYASGKLVIEPDTSKIDALTTDNVTSADEENIKAVQAMMASAETDGIDEATAEQWAAITTKCEDLTQKIEAVEAENGRIADAVSKFDLATVKSSDETAISQLILDIDEQLATNNLTDEGRSELEGLKTKCNNLIAKIDGTETLIGQLKKTVDDLDAETVRSTDKAALEQVIADAQTLIVSGSVTEAEKEALVKTQEDAKALIKVIDDTAAEHKKLTDQAAVFDEDTVKSTDKTVLEQLAKDIEDLLDTGNLTEDERKTLEDAKADAEALIEKIEAAQDATDTENTEKVEDVTADNVKPEDKEALEDAKADLEKTLEDNAGNYTEEERKAIQDEIQRIEDAMVALENVEDVTDSITQLPDTVEPDDEETAKKILAAKESYDELTDHEKSLVDETTKKKLDDLVTALTAYHIIRGDGGKWTKGSDGSLTFTANGPFTKFVGIEVDGKEVDAKYYDAKAGSTIITLKQSFLKRLSTGEHTITVLYTDGETSGTFKILAQSSSPATGDDSNIMMYGSTLIMSLTALIVLFLASKKREQETA